MSTPPPKLTSAYPSYGPQILDPLFFVAFDQRIDPEAVFAHITVTANGQELMTGLRRMVVCVTLQPQAGSFINRAMDVYTFMIGEWNSLPPGY